MRLLIFDDYDAVSEFAANHVANCIRKFAPTAEKRFVLGLPTGSSPLGMYRRLVDMHRAKEISFEFVTTFNMDEYVGLGVSHPQSYHTFMFDNFFRHIDIDPLQVNIPNGEADDLLAECRTYEEKISGAGGIHLFVAGIGSDGHIAFNEPGTSLQSGTHVQTLASETIEANSRFFDFQLDKVPRRALTVGIGTIMGADEVMVLVSGQAKAYALHKSIEAGVSHMWTTSAIAQLHPSSTFVVDEDACLELKVKTVKYFKDIQRLEEDKE